MATNFPTSKDTVGSSGSLPVEPSGTPLATQHIAAHQNESDAIVALETKLGIDSSADTTTIDYQLKSSSSVNPGHLHTLAGALTDVLITSPSDGNGLIYNGSASKWENGTSTIADASTTVKGLTMMSVAPVSSTSPIAVGQNDPVLTSLSGTATSAVNPIVDEDSLATTTTNNAVVRANSSGVIDKSFLTLINKFGGTGADGALNVTSGTTTIALGSAGVVVKNYTSINVSSGATLNFSGPASTGTTVILKSQGNVTIAGTLDITGMGNQNPGSGGTVPGGAGGNGGSGGNILDSLTTHGGQAVTAGIQYSFPFIFHTQNQKSIFLAPGSAGAGGGGGTNGTGSGAVGGAGGKGAGSIYIECAGTYSATGTLTAAGTAGTAGTNQSGGGNGGGGGGGGGGGAGDVYVIYNILGTDSATYTVTGGAGGGGGSGSNANGASGGLGGGSGANSDNAGNGGGGQSAGSGGTGGTGAAGVAIRELNVTWA